MSFDEDDHVVLHDKHSEFDGETGTITQTMESMFGDTTYTISFEDGQEAGVPEDSLEAAEDVDEATVEDEEDDEEDDA
ncbi:DUF1918 domain-containing protein [Natronosalvus caseinilyticus]|uniref:DUF1918 domain-containing protein n=1 Tax=Natronosalvus caseinilyticus TaxID=2953747 RepID=UPI0028AD5BB6|nr:DUF1918 domain-containing protein [Natronosalvus caseinilyticus]